MLTTDYDDEASDFVKARFIMFRKMIAEKTISNGKNNTKKFLPMAIASEVGLLFGIVTNTQPAAFWTLYYILAADAGDQKKFSLLEKVRSKVQQNPYDPDQWHFLEACMTEAFRLSWGGFQTRDVIKPATITTSQGTTFKVRLNDRVTTFPTLHHLDANNFPDPLTFDPNRWLNADDKNLMKLKRVVNVFGGGVSMCPGRRFAQREIKMLAAKLIQHFDITFIDQSQRPKPGALVSKGAGRGIYPPAEPVYVKLALRKS